MSERFITGYITKSSSNESSPTFVLNEESADRMGDVIEVAGWDLAQFKKNPIALWQHNHEKPIGTWHNVRVEGKRLIGALKLAGTNLAKMAQQLIDEGVLKAVSVGFIPKEHEPIDEKDPYGGWRIKAAELLEVSLVSVPAHPKALLLSKRLGLSNAERRLVFESAVSGVNPEVQRASAALEAARRALRK